VTSRLTRRGAATRARIVAGAAELMYARGVAGTSLDDIMEATGTSKSQLYHYFTGKDALVLDVIRSQLDQIIAGQEVPLRELRSWAGLQRWCDHVVAATRATRGVGGCRLGSLASELADRSEPARHVLAGCFAEWEGHLSEGFVAMQYEGELSEDADPEALATAVMAALQGGLLLSQTARGAQPLELAMDMALDHVGKHRTTS
jgi:TetR/AcrR family transcriptional regulator, transcriptional repressor for nem operon